MVDENGANYCAIKQMFGLNFVTSKMVSCQMHYRHDVNMAAFRIRASFSDEFQSICDKMYTIATIEQYYEWKNSWMKLLICSLTYPEGLPGGMQRSTPCFLLLDNLATPTSHRLKAASNA